MSACEPLQIRSDNGPEFVSKAVEQWAYDNGVDWHFIEPGKPIENAYIESFNVVVGVTPTYPPLRHAPTRCRMSLTNLFSSMRSCVHSVSN